MKKRFLSMAMAAVMFSSVGTVLPVMDTAVYAEEDEEKTYEQLKYKIVDEEYVEITGCDKEATETVIPAEIDGLPVKSIGDYAFLLCNKLTSIMIPDSVTSIGEYAFGSSALTNITIPCSVISIGKYAFSGCSALTSITISNGVKNISPYAFNQCEKITSITIPESMTSISGGLFSGCAGLTSIMIPNSVTSTCNIHKGSGINENFTIDKSRQIGTMATKENIL